jgi:hypothetical protein
MATKKEEQPTLFERLSAINVNDKVEKKNGLAYLSWAWAWSAFKRECPDASYSIGETTYDEQLGFMCYTSVTAEGQTLSMWLPVMDGANKSMRKEAYEYSTRYGNKTVEAATTFDINKTLMRCLVKNLAMFGLGIYIFAGEDLPEVVGDAPQAAAQTATATATKKKDVSASTSASKNDADAGAANVKGATDGDAANTKAGIELVKDSDNWKKVAAYVTANKEKGLDAILQQVKRRYSVTDAIKAEIETLINA